MAIIVESQVRTAPQTGKWLWLALFLLGWGGLVQVVSTLGALVLLSGSGAGVTLLVNSLLISVLAYVVGRIALRAGAPRSIWIPVALNSLPALALLALAALAWFADTTGPPMNLAAAATGAILYVVGPPAILFMLGRSGMGSDAAPREATAAS